MTPHELADRRRRGEISPQLVEAAARLGHPAVVGETRASGWWRPSTGAELRLLFAELSLELIPLGPAAAARRALVRDEPHAEGGCVRDTTAGTDTVPDVRPGEERWVCAISAARALLEA